MCLGVEPCGIRGGLKKHGQTGLFQCENLGKNWSGWPGGNLFQAVEPVAQRKNRVAVHHAGSCVSHHLPDLLPLLRVVTMDRALRAGWFLIREGAFLQTFLRIRQELGTLRAQILRGPVCVPAMDGHHGSQGSQFPGESRRDLFHLLRLRSQAQATGSP
jgi:hypothetical protein